MHMSATVCLKLLSYVLQTICTQEDRCTIHCACSVLSLYLDELHCLIWICTTFQHACVLGMHLKSAFSLCCALSLLIQLIKIMMNIATNLPQYVFFVRVPGIATFFCC